MSKIIEPRPYQGRIVEGTINGFLHENHKRIIVESPTGSGKTVMALMAAKALQDLIGELKVGWVYKREPLKHQVLAENENINVANLMPFSMFDNNPPHEIDLLVVDECHNDSTDTMNFIHDTVDPKYVLGLSATPFRRDKARLHYSKTLKEAGYCSLIRQGYLASYRHYLMDDYKEETVAQTYIRYKDSFGKTVMFFLNSDQMFEVQRQLVANGIHAETVHSSMSKREVNGTILRFHNNEFPVLLNLFILTEGFDCPDLQTVFVRDVLRQTKGAQVQMAGRVLRPYKVNGTPMIKNIVQSKMSGVKFDATAAPCEQFIWNDDDWRKIELKPEAVVNKTKEVRAKRLEMILKGQLPDMPKYLLDKQLKMKKDIRVIQQDRIDRRN